MKTLKLLILVLTMLPLTVNGQSTVKGSLKGYDGKPMKLAHIYLNKGRRDLNNTIEVIRVDIHGNFELSIPGNGLFVITFTGVNHKPSEVPVLVDKNSKTLEVMVNLGTFDYEGTMDNAAVIGDFNQFQLSGRIPFQRGTSGAYFATIPTGGKAINYQVVGLAKHDFIATSAFKAQPYTTSDYTSDLYTAQTEENGKDSVEINISWDQLPLGGIQESISFSDSIYQQCYEVMAHLNNRTPVVMGRYMSARANGDDFVHDVREELSALETRIAKANDNKLRDFLYKSYIEIQGLRNSFNDSDKRVLGRPKKQVALKALNEVPLNSPLWNTTMLGSLITILGQDFSQSESEIFEIIDGAEGTTKSWMLMNVGLFCNENGFGEAYENCRDILEDEFPESGALNQLKIRTKKKEIVVGNYIPEFEVGHLKNETKITKQDLKGKIYLIDFWATWCGPCVAELPNLTKAYQKYKKQGFNVLSISVNREKKVVEDFRKMKPDYEMPWLHAWAEEGYKSDIAKRFEVTHVPFTILVDEQGKIISDSHLTGEKLLSTLEEVFRER